MVTDLLGVAGDCGACGAVAGGDGCGSHEAQAEHQGDQGGGGGAGQVTVEGGSESVHGHLLGCVGFVCGTRLSVSEGSFLPSLVLYSSTTLLKCQATSPIQSRAGYRALERAGGRRV